MPKHNHSFHCRVTIKIMNKNKLMEASSDTVHTSHSYWFIMNSKNVELTHIHTFKLSNKLQFSYRQLKSLR